MNKKATGTIFIIALMISGCSSTKMADKKWQPTYRIQAGINKGGIVENTEFENSKEIPVYAYSGATSLGANAGAHISLPVGKNSIESGLDFMLNQQKFEYHDEANQYKGTSQIMTYQIMFPVVYSIGFFKNIQPGGLFQVKVGYLAQLNFLHQVKKSGSTPQYDNNSYSGGFTAGIASTPFKLKNGNMLGFYFDVYRGGQVYKDFYNKTSYEEPGSAFIKTGIIYHFGK